MNAAASSRRLFAVDIGNSAVKIGFYPAELQGVPKQPAHSLRFAHENLLDGLSTISSPEPVCWVVAGVHRAVELQLREWLSENRPDDRYSVLYARDFPIELDVCYPDRVGTDRLAAAVAVNKRRGSRKAAIVIDVGTAVTVDLVCREGLFRGGAIFPGPAIAAAAFVVRTDALPPIRDVDFASMPEPVGKSTEAAIQSGVGWGCLGAVKELVARMSRRLSATPIVYSTGGGGQMIASHLGRDVQFDPHLVLTGVAIAGRSCCVS